MAAILNITDGTITVDLLSAKVDYQILAGNLTHSIAAHNQIRRSSAFAEGEAIISSQPKNVIASFSLAIYGANHDAIATNLQKLATLRREAKEAQVTPWQKTPVYMTEKALNETNTRYARVISIEYDSSSIFEPLFNDKSIIRRVSIRVEREPYWRSNIPLAIPTALTLGAPQAPANQVDPTKQFVANFRDTTALTHIYNEDNSAGPAYSANLIATVPFTYFVVGASTPALNDCVYFGSTQGPFRHAVLNIGAVASYSATLTWEIWTGAAWTSGRVKEDNTFLVQGTRLITIDNPTGWAATVINGVNAYWVRVRISAFTSWTTSPTQVAQVVYNPRDCYISIANDQIDGDVDALALIRYYKQFGTVNGINLAAMGVKSRGLTTFTSVLNAGGQNPTGWLVAYGADTLQTADVDAPGGNNATCTFAGTLNSWRVIWSCSTRAMIADMEGEYNVYLRCQQVGGAVGAVSVRLRQTAPSTAPLPAYTPLTAVSQGPELVNLGRISILPSRVLASDEAAPASLYLQLDANIAADTADLEIFDVHLIPVDECAFVAASVQQTVNSTDSALDMDGGVVRDGATYKIESVNAVIEPFQARAPGPRLPPDKALQIHFLLGSWNNIVLSDIYLGGGIKVWTHERWEMMRGAE